MGKKILWAAVSCIMALSLVMVACGSGTTEPTAEPTAEPTTGPTAEPTSEPTQEPTAEPGTPQYGGKLTRHVTIDPSGWDPYPSYWHQTTGSQPCMQSMWIGDWGKGPLGTGEFQDVQGGRFATMTGQLFDSWEVFPDGHTIYHITEGIHFWESDNPGPKLVGGREFTAYDAEYAINRQAKGKSYQSRAIPQASADLVCTALDKYTIQIEIYPEEAYAVNYFFGSYHAVDQAKEVVEEFGDFNTWDKLHGVGPFIITDYVPASQMTYIKNPNYHRTNPATIGYGDPLPYLDELQILIIPDASTRQAAIRTAKLDTLNLVTLDDSANVIKTTPELEVYYAYSGTNAMFMRTDNPERPYADKMVRQALYKATDFDGINKAIRGGMGTNPGWPLAYIPALDDYFLHIEDASDIIKDMYTYDPDKAKKMLADAGYPNGFTAKVVVSSAGAYVDEVAILKSMWEKIGVELTMDVKEAGSFRTISNYRKHEDMIYAAIGATTQLWPRGFGNLHSGVGFNMSYIDEEWLMQAVSDYHTAWLEGNEAERIRLSTEVVIPGVLEEAYVVGMPASRTVTFWWPWVKGYGGLSAGAFQTFPHQYIWIDRELKKEMGY